MPIQHPRRKDAGRDSEAAFMLASKEATAASDFEIPESISSQKAVEALDPKESKRPLKVLTLYGCSTLTQIPDSLGNLPELQELNLRMCSGLTQLPPRFGDNLQALKMLHCPPVSTQLQDRLPRETEARGALA